MISTSMYLKIYQISFVNRYVLHTLTIWIAGFSVNVAFISKWGRNVIVEANRYIFYFIIRKCKMQHIIIPTVKASIKFYYWCNLTSFKLYKQNVNFHYNSAFCEVRSDIQMRFFQYFRLFIIAMCLLVMLAMKEARQTQILTGEL